MKVNDDTNKELLTKSELMEYLSISKSTVRNYINKGYLKPLGVERRVWFRKSDVLEVIEKAV
ncbi:helix-turn-helix domain-containing protein [Flavobacteriaceae bacterium]|nr:helix-turn-helix domain-containing protein [Flavobacteriaceae bacterium]